MAKKVSGNTKKVEKKIVDVIEADNIPTPTVEEVIENIENVEVELPVNEGLKEIEEKIAEVLTPLAELTDEIANVGQVTEELNQKITESPEAAQEYIEESIKKAETVKKKIDKVLANAETNSNVSNWWNGMGYDF